MRNSLFILSFFSVFFLKAQDMAFIYGGGNWCANDTGVNVAISLNGTAPWTLVYAIDGVNQSVISTTINPFVISVKMAGVYTVSSVADALGVGTASGSAVVVSSPIPNANFFTASDTISALSPILSLHDNTLGSVAWQWNFGDGSPTEFLSDPVHTFPIDSNGIGIPAIYQVYLIASNSSGCSDTTFKQIFVQDEYFSFIPSAFSPDKDGKNDRFCLQSHAIRKHAFYFRVFNSRGDVVFYTKNADSMQCGVEENGWDGLHKDTQKELPMGTYVFEVYFQDFEGWKHHDFGTIQLIR